MYKYKFKIYYIEITKQKWETTFKIKLEYK